MGKYHAVVNITLAVHDGTQLALQQGFAQRCDIINKDMALQVFVLMLDDAGTDAFKDLLVLLKVLVKVFDADFVGTHHLFINIGQAKAAFLEWHLVAESLKEFGIDESLLEVLGRRIIGIEGVAIHDEEADGLVDLGRGKTDAFGVGQRLPHVIQQGLQLGIVGSDGLRDGFQRGVAVCYYG